MHRIEKMGGRERRLFSPVPLHQKFHPVFLERANLLILPF
jgi:hypothetical protein